MVRRSTRTALQAHPHPGRRSAAAFGGLLTLALALAISLSGTRLGAATSTNAPLAAGEAELLAEMAAQGTNVTRLYRLADLCHDAGVDGDKAAVLRAEAYLRELLRQQPTNAPATTLLGSVYTIKGRDAFWPTQQLRLVHEGNELMDQGVRLAPQDIQTRLLRAFNNAHMPDFLGRTEIVRADLAWLWEKVEKEPASFTVGQQQELALHWGRQLKRQHRPAEARSVWERGRALAPDSRRGGELAAELAKLR